MILTAHIGELYYKGLDIRVDMVGMNHNKVLTQ